VLNFRIEHYNLKLLPDPELQILSTLELPDELPLLQILSTFERENPVFKEMVKIAITPMISSLSLLNYVDMNSESEVLGYGISLILLNLGMYLGVPAVVIIGIKKKF